MDSYRCELVGIYCIMVVVQKFCEYYHISEGSLPLTKAIIYFMIYLAMTLFRLSFHCEESLPCDGFTDTLGVTRIVITGTLIYGRTGTFLWTQGPSNTYPQLEITLGTSLYKGNLGRCGWVQKSSLPDFNRRFTPTFMIMTALHTGRINRAVTQRL
jgi:hypothetical protein